MTNEMVEVMDMKRAIISYGMSDRHKNEEEIHAIKPLIDKIKNFSRRNNAKKTGDKASEDMSE